MLVEHKNSKGITGFDADVSKKKSLFGEGN